MQKIEIVFQPGGKRANFYPGTSILKAAQELGVDLKAVCSGQEKCGKCKIIVEKGKENIGLITEAEGKILSELELKMGYRLACTAICEGNVMVSVPDESRIGQQRLQIEGIETFIDLDPAIKKLVVTMQKPSLSDPTSDEDRLFLALKKWYNLNEIEIDFETYKKLPFALREGDWTATAVVWNNKKILDIEPNSTIERAYGFAVDIGSTKLAGYLVDLNTGEVIDTGSQMNPQIPYGEDVMSRINYTLKGPEALKELQEAVVGGINKILDQLLPKANVKRQEIYEMAAVGNTAMHHIFLGIPPNGLSAAPFPPVIGRTYTDVKVKTAMLGVNINPNANVHVLPVIAGFVGADTVAAILASEIYKSERLCFLIDIGTNTEIVIGNKDHLVACSCASGPAFEGMHIKHGMRAATGAIEQIEINPKLEVEYRTIDDAKPVGICGSGMVDALAEMLKEGIVQRTGAITKDLNTPRLRKNEKGSYEFVIAWKDETVTEWDIVITQEDVRELQLAKAAMYTGATILMKKRHLTASDIERVLIAGAFGNHINPESTLAIGMFPNFPLEIMRPIGNAAGSGARMALLSTKGRKVAQTIAKRVEYVELAADPDFTGEFSKATFLPHLSAL